MKNNSYIRKVALIISLFCSSQTFANSTCDANEFANQGHYNPKVNTGIWNANDCSGGVRYGYEKINQLQNRYVQENVCSLEHLPEFTVVTAINSNWHQCTLDPRVPKPSYTIETVPGYGVSYSAQASEVQLKVCDTNNMPDGFKVIGSQIDYSCGQPTVGQNPVSYTVTNKLDASYYANAVHWDVSGNKGVDGCTINIHFKNGTTTPINVGTSGRHDIGNRHLIDSINLYCNSSTYKFNSEVEVYAGMRVSLDNTFLISVTPFIAEFED